MQNRLALLVAIVATCLLVRSAMAQAEPKPAILSPHDQIKADRAKAAREEAASTIRPWDRDANGKRPWEIKPDVGK